jgi:hypothetical protein
MCTAYESIVKDFQTNLASFVNVNCITPKLRSSFNQPDFFDVYFLGSANAIGVHSESRKNHGEC